MITRSAAAGQGGATDSGDWQRLLREAIRDGRTLCRRLELDPATVDLDPDSPFPVCVPEPFLARIRPGDPDDPLLRQVLPRRHERETVPGFTADPLGEQSANPVPGLLHKYAGRALLTVSPACAVHCRYCFRRHFPYPDNTPGRAGWQPALDYLRRDDSITEVILSGGDPLSVSNDRLRWLGDALTRIPHLRRLRLHTRYPVVLPQRLDAGFHAWLDDLALPVVLVIHSNHPAELDATVAAALAPLRSRVTVLNQAVLLRGVNDHADTLIRLSERLFALGVLPYYLHQLDRTAGTHDFELSDARARHLHAALQARLPGYLVPRLVREIAGQPGKTWTTGG